MEISKLMPVSVIKTEEPFKSLFAIDEKVLSAIEENMKGNNYDASKPITIWKGPNIVIDGHTRLKAARNIGRFGVMVVERNFKDEDDALRYALRNQRNRRNLDGATILHLVETLDNMYQRGGDRRSIFATTKVDLFAEENTPHESSREVTARLIGTTAEKVSQCRHVLQECSDSEIKEIRDREKTLYKVYRASLAAKKNEEKKAKDQEARLKIMEELKTGDFPCGWTKEEIRHHTVLVEKLRTIALKLLPNLEKQASDVQEIIDIVEYFKNQGDEKFKTFLGREPVRRFLGSLFVNDFIVMLKAFGFHVRVMTPRNLRVIKEERVVPVKKKRPAPQPHCNIGRVHEVGFMSKAESREADRRMEHIVERDMEEG